jgi:flagellar capping protein FliD
MGDSGIQNLQSTIKAQLATAAIVPTGSAYKTLADIGVSTGAYGSAVNSTNHLVLDTTKLATALQSNPTAVFNVLGGLAGTATLTNAIGTPIGVGSSWVQSITGSPTGVAQSGVYKVTYTPSATPNNLSAIFNPTGFLPQAAITGPITAGGATSIIAGLTITAKAAPAAGTEYVKYTVTTGGVLQQVNTYVNSLLATGAIFDAESTSATAQSKRIDDQVAAMTARLATRQATLQRQFTGMELALQKLQTQSAALARLTSPSTTTQ